MYFWVFAIRNNKKKKHLNLLNRPLNLWSAFLGSVPIYMYYLTSANHQLYEETFPYSNYYARMVQKMRQESIEAMSWNCWEISMAFFGCLRATLNSPCALWSLIFFCLLMCPSLCKRGCHSHGNVNSCPEDGIR